MITLRDATRLPVDGTFDVIWLYSVLTHLEFSEARTLLTLARQVIRPTGRLLLTAFVDPAVAWCEARGNPNPLQGVFYSHAAIEEMTRDAGWTLRFFHPGGPRPFIQPCFVCET